MGKAPLIETSDVGFRGRREHPVGGGGSPREVGTRVRDGGPRHAVAQHGGRQALRAGAAARPIGGGQHEADANVGRAISDGLRGGRQGNGLRGGGEVRDGERRSHGRHPGCRGVGEGTIGIGLGREHEHLELRIQQDRIAGDGASRTGVGDGIGLGRAGYAGRGGRVVVARAGSQGEGGQQCQGKVLHMNE